MGRRQGPRGLVRRPTMDRLSYRRRHRHDFAPTKPEPSANSKCRRQSDRHDGDRPRVMFAVVGVLVTGDVYRPFSFRSWYRGVWAAYPILDAVLLALVVRTLVERRTHTMMGVLLTAGVACWLVSDSVMLLVPDSFVGDLLDVGWMVGAALLAGAIGSIPPQGPTTARPVPKRSGRVRDRPSDAPLLVPGVIEMIAYSRGHGRGPGAIDGRHGRVRGAR